MTDEMYLKMILALPDKFFDGWEWKEGDAFLYKEDESESYSMGYIGTHILTNRKPVGFMDVCFDPFENLSGLRPIPSISQLHTLCGKIDSEFTDWKTFYFELCSGVGCSHSADPRDIRFNKFGSVEEAGLALAVELSLDMYWDGEKWV